MIGEAAQRAFFNEEWLQWVGEAYGASGLGVAGTALFVMFMGALGLYNWTETFKVPAVWLAITAPLLAGALPAPIVWRVVGIVTTAVAMLFVALWLYWRRM
jgi:hypothetical protein